MDNKLIRHLLVLATVVAALTAQAFPSAEIRAQFPANLPADYFVDETPQPDPSPLNKSAPSRNVCVKGQPCGNTCISWSYICHISTAPVVITDTTPNAFSFTAQTNAAPGGQTVSNAIAVSGITSLAPVSIRGGNYSINNASFTAGSGYASQGDQIRVQVVAPALTGSTASATLTIGGVSATFYVTTQQQQTQSATECLFNWIEDSYPVFLAPNRQLTVTAAPYSFRHYSGTNASIGVSSDTNHLYYLGPLTGLVDLGATSTWIMQAGCH